MTSRHGCGAKGFVTFLANFASAGPDLLSYWMRQRDLASEEAFLQERLWLPPRDQSEQGEGNDPDDSGDYKAAS
jgi:hypothetical protein